MRAMKRRIQHRIPSGHPPLSLLGLLTTRFTYHTREEWGARIAENRVLVNGVPAEAARLLAGGDEVEFIAHDIPEPPVSFDLRILFEDYDVMVVDKPANLPCHPAGRYFNHTLWARLKTQYCVESPLLINRLDRETSGLVLVAKQAPAEAHCRSQFAQRRVVKRYVVLVEGEFPAERQAAGWLVPDPESGVRKRRRFIEAAADASPGEGAEWAQTEFRRMGVRDGISAVEALLQTGRLHQIRATLGSLGYPVVGDKVYGVDPLMFVRFCDGTLSPGDWRRLRLARQALHAAELEFTHPSTGQVLQFQSPVPPDMAALMGPG